ncbi:sensor histidine kinase [Pseudonocardia lacus]|uniref:sensor histidine kinase n=1 Tax=Pseudonocardia lacus TaxID=2835865 RepID=UPI001BDCA24D|nr:sensor histidine kinase [Pseudonocardia lacus]
MRDRVRRAAAELGQLLTAAGIGLAGLFLLVLMLISVPAGLVAGVGIPLFVTASRLARRLADLQRRRVGAVLGQPIPSPYPPLPTGLFAQARALVRASATWRDLTWSLCQLVVGVAGAGLGLGLWLTAGQCLVAPLLRVVLPADATFDPVVLELVGRSGPTTWLLVPVGAALVVVAHRVPRPVLVGQARLAAALLEPTAAVALSARVDELTATRTAAVDASAVELRRVERDLHDGAQVRLVAVAMSLGMAEDVIDSDPAAAKALMVEAKAGTGAALSELRDLVRGIHPPVLADRGLPGALQALALGGGIPVELDVRLDRRLTDPVESAAYFAVAEGLTNAIRYSSAHRIQVAVLDEGRVLRIRVRDDGRGGADPTRGTGLRGIRRRLSAFDGTLRVSSPVGGPTVLDMELPCAS